MSLILIAMGFSLPLLLLGGCSGEQPAAPGKPLALVVSGDTAGRIIPCGCTSNQSGGLPRRGAYLNGLREQQTVIYLDAGGAPGGVSPYNRAKFEAILQAELALDLAAHNIGRGEAELGAAYLRKLEQDLKIPFLSTNVRDSSGNLVTEPVRMIEAEGRQLAVLGVLSPQYAGPVLQIDPPERAILETLRGLEDRPSAVVVLAYLPEVELLELAGRLPEVDLVVGGPTGQNIPPRLVGPTLVASATNQGKFVAEFQAPLKEADNWTGSLVEMAGTYADDPEQSANLKTFYERLAREDFSAAETSFTAEPPRNVPKAFRIVGTSACRDCHVEECKVWDTSGHARAWKSLEETGAHVDSDCQRCHTTAYGQPGGFVSLKSSPLRRNVGCESCHGPSGAHADDPALPTAYSKQAAGQCLKCHDPENSPSFIHDEYWPRIEH